MHSWVQKTSRSRGGRVVRLAVQRWGEVDGDQRAAAFAWYLLVSLLPLVIVLVTIVSLFVEREQAAREIVGWMNQFTPLTWEQERETLAAARGLLEGRSRINALALALLVWGSLAFLQTLIKTTNHVWRAPACNWWRLPLKSLALLGVTVSAVLLGVVVPAIARLVQRWFAAHLALPDWAFATLFRFIPWLVLFGGLIMMYRLAPSRRTTFSEVWIGALTATASIWIGQTLFLQYVLHIASFSVVYGTLGGLVVFLLWIYYSSSICVFGVCLAAAQAETAAKGAVHGDGELPAICAQGER